MRTALLLTVLLLTHVSLAAPAKEPAKVRAPVVVDFESPKAVVDAIPANLYPAKEGEKWNAAGFTQVEKWAKENVFGRTIRCAVSPEFMAKRTNSYEIVWDQRFDRHGISHLVWIAFDFPMSMEGKLSELGKEDRFFVRGKVVAIRSDDDPSFSLTVDVNAIEGLVPRREEEEGPLAPNVGKPQRCKGRRGVEHVSAPPPFPSLRPRRF
jgi:hypothetical protein